MGYDYILVWDSDWNLIKNNVNAYDLTIATDYLSLYYFSYRNTYFFQALKPATYVYTTRAGGNAGITTYKNDIVRLTSSDTFPYTLTYYGSTGAFVFK